MSQDCSQALQAQVQEAAAQKRPLRILGGDSKSRFGRTPRGEPLRLASHEGVIHYAPTELVIKARAGTCLLELQRLLAEHQQMLAFEPPLFSEQATLGGVIACGLSGPRRPYAGAARDFVLGVTLLNGRGEILHFGGEVMKNVAGYDVSRLMAGALGTLGVLLDISLKVLPLPALEITLVQSCDAATAVERMNQYAARPLPLSAACHWDGQLHMRLSGASSAVRAAQQALGGEELAGGALFWQQVREQQGAFFQADLPLWRFSMPPTAPALTQPCFMDWGGAQRWLHAPLSSLHKLRQQAEHAGGHVHLFRGGEQEVDVFHPLSPAVLRVHQGLKRAFDPSGILNPGRLYAALTSPDDNY